ncbi:MAG: hypothetical protein ACOCX5_01940 [Chloroflexota bacterium]
MPVLLLAQGDPAAKDKLRHAIEARYGLRPPAIDSLKIDFKGRSRIKLGPVTTWVPLDLTAYFRFPTAMRWDFIVKPMKLPIQRGVGAYDGETYRTVRGNKAPTVIAENDQVSSMRRRLWAMASVLLTPLSDTFVKLTEISNTSLEARNTRLDDAAEIILRPDNTIDHVKVVCLNPESGEQQAFTIQLSTDMVTLNELIIPARLTMAWDNANAFEVEPVAVDNNPNLPDSIFTIE